jgi:hypothetical protein
MTVYYKAVRPNGTDFHTGKVRWAPPAGHEGEWVVTHPTSKAVGDHPSKYLSVSTVPTDCTGMNWPCRLLEVETVNGSQPVTLGPKNLPNKRAAVAWRVVGERPAREALGPQGQHVTAMVSRAKILTMDEAERLSAAWDDAAGDAAGYATWNAAWNATGDAARVAARDAAWDAARNAARDAARYATWNAAPDAARYATWYTAGVLVVRDLIGSHGFTQEHYDTLTRPWRIVIGPIHPDDAEMSA